ncbi:hypothetical protein HJC23_009981 [Cyclotella cryptica]|uniref:Uncharacterized protein n=1 Tax=Cyclotella cryptica TaxID=29204 RepID=A0ABD3QA99_9STRA|eukprot:CCRYP_007754-RB/>CCRYP_007754-RB protein AED:0.06 eAED:0.06 QI:223/1/1/1/0.45/0.25/12/4467/730
MSPNADRNAEIWSTRLQREILALESSDDESRKMELLPPFITVVGHTLNIEGGIAKIEFRIDVELGDDGHMDGGDATGKAERKEGGVSGDADGKPVGEGVNADEDTKMEAEKTDTETKEPPEPIAADDEDQNDKVAVECPPETQADQHVILVLDASMYWKPSDGSTQHEKKHPSFYPFQKPLAVLKSGSHHFSGGSTISNGDEVDIDLDWTPSIHLSDAVTNVALKIRECIKRGEPLHPSPKEEEDDDDDEGLLTKALIREAREAKESLLETKKAVGAIFSSFSSGIAAKSSSLGSSLAAKSQTMRGTFSSAMGESLSAFVDGGGAKLDDTAVEEKEDETQENQARGGMPAIGEEIDLSENPWNQCIGMYSCKAIRRPAFVEAAMAEAAEKKKSQETTTSPAFATAGSMFSRFAQSAKSVMEETFLMITEEYVVEFKSNRLNIGSGTVTFSINIDKMAKLKFRREESLSLFFKEATDDPLVYMCLDSALAVQDIQNVLKRHGVKGKHTNAATQRAVQMALNMVALIQQKEAELLDNPNVDRVNEIMDLYRQAAEKFEQAGDPRHAEVMLHMKRFLNQSFTTSILDGSFVKTSSPVSKKSASSVDEAAPAAVPQGEILEQPSYNLSNDDDDDDESPMPVVSTTSSTGSDEIKTPTKPEPEKLNETFQDVDDIIEEAKRDMEEIGMGNDDIFNILNSPPSKSSNVDGDNDDAFAELDAMLSDADKELNDLLNS